MTGTPSRIGFVGLGNIGLPMAEVLVGAGYDVVGVDIDEDAREKFRATGGSTAETPADAARGAEGVHVAVVTDAQTEDVVLGDAGVFDGFEATGEGGVVVIHGTVLPETVQAIAAQAPEGVSVLDAPVSGGPGRAGEGDLAVMVGGEEAAVEAYEPVLDALARKLVYVGEVGSGLVVKLTHQSIWYASVCATLEALKTGREFGIDTETMIEVYEEGTASCFFVQNYDYWMNERPDSHGFDLEESVDLGRKDMNSYLNFAYHLEQPVPMASIVAQLYPEAMTEALTADEG